MGVDKALVEVGGVAMAERVARAVAAAGCDPVVFVGGDVHRLGRLGRPVHADRWPGGGPVGGVVTALTVLDDDVLVAACDLVDLDAATVRRVVDAGRTSSADVAVATTERLQPLLSWWRHGSLEDVAAAWAAGVVAVHEVIGALSSVLVTVATDAVRNVNRPGDLP